METRHLPRAALLLAIVTSCVFKSHSAQVATWPVIFEDAAEPNTSETQPEPLFRPAVGAVEKRSGERQKTAVASSGVPVKGHDITLAEAVQLAMGWHPVIKRAEREYVQSKESVNEAKAGWYPSLSARVKSGLEQEIGRAHV